MTASDLIQNASLWKRINQRGGSFLFVAVLFGVCALTHLLATFKMGSSFALVDDRTIGEINLIGFVERHFWILGVYFGFLLSAAFWLGMRSASRGITFLSLLLLSVPLLLYIRACSHIFFKIHAIPGVY